MKINDKLDRILNECDSPTGSPGKPKPQKTYYSFEYFPPKTQAGVENLLDRIERMG